MEFLSQIKVISSDAPRMFIFIEENPIGFIIDFKQKNSIYKLDLGTELIISPFQANASLVVPSKSLKNARILCKNLLDNGFSFQVASKNIYLAPTCEIEPSWISICGLESTKRSYLYVSKNSSFEDNNNPEIYISQLGCQLYGFTNYERIKYDLKDFNFFQEFQYSIRLHQVL